MTLINKATTKKKKKKEKRNHVCEIQETNVVCAHKFPGFAKKGRDGCMYHIRLFLEFQLLFQAPLLLKIFFSKYQIFLHFFQKKKKMPKE